MDIFTNIRDKLENYANDFCKNLTDFDASYNNQIVVIMAPKLKVKRKIKPYETGVSNPKFKNSRKHESNFVLVIITFPFIAYIAFDRLKCSPLLLHLICISSKSNLKDFST